MFARQVLRPAKTLQRQVRRYASESSPKGGSNTIAYGIVGIAALLGGTYYINSRGTPNPAQVPTLKELTPTLPPSSGAPPKVTFTGGDQGFLSLKLDSVDIVTPNVKRLRFALPEEDAVSGIKTTSAIITKYKGPNMEKPVIRPYTPTSDEETRGFMEFHIKRYPDGPMSQHLHNMEPGQRLDIKGPIPKYPWAPNKHEHIALIAGGTGITPMWQLANTIFKNQDDKTKVTLVFGNISEDDIILKREWEHLENTYPQRFRAFYTLDKPSETWKGGKGFITKDLLKTVLPEPKEGEKVKIFVCGPPGMYKAISGTKKSPADQGELEGYLKELGYSKDQVYKF
ncbi:ferredoxin reductase-like protein [Patellaria atrata CBS 101060]|uniref:NADH-cytochrome b5 reductase n=1 Tax=Patellaria atrata CBS 101060 TaxID=1346257 RepID=A0A9P4VTC8_9PEZI|nr:ferredoxin reductase-like protein [Patellaria atrata CBS 101060]